MTQNTTKITGVEAREADTKEILARLERIEREICRIKAGQDRINDLAVTAYPTAIYCSARLEEQSKRIDDLSRLSASILRGLSVIR
jgi:hypothetical protein